MNNNRNNNSGNNRRRGRGNRNQGGGGGGNQGNRIDSRARGNAPQMLDKYKKLAQDAQHHGDRVQAEYYLQFADHYFRVIADNRSRQEEPRGEQRGDQRFGRRDEREQDDFGLDEENDGDTGNRYEGPRESRETARDGQREQRPRREERPRNRYEERAGEGTAIEAEDTAVFAPDENPFVREMRDDTAPRPKRAPRQRRTNGQEPGIDAAVLPPAFSANDAGDGDDGAAAEPAPRRRRKRGDGETLSAVG